MFVPHACLVPEDVRKGYPDNPDQVRGGVVSLHDGVNSTVRVPGTKLGSSGQSPAKTEAREFL